MYLPCSHYFLLGVVVLDHLAIAGWARTASTVQYSTVQDCHYSIVQTQYSTGLPEHLWNSNQEPALVWSLESKEGGK